MKKLNSSLNIGGVFTFICTDKNGKLKWIDQSHNLVTNEGLQDAIDVYFISGSQSANWYVGLTGATPSPAAGDTLASHAGWTEFSDYTGNRQTYTGVRSSQTISNSASKASFAITQDSSSVGGAFLTNVASGTSGKLFCVVAFTGGNKSVDNGDTLTVQYDLTFADDGA